MQTGRLDRRIVIQSVTTAADSYGEPIETWADLDTVWAAYEPLRGREYFEAQQIDAQLEAKFTIRYRDDITVQMRIVHDGDTYGIASVREIGRRDGTELLAKALNP